jgi:uncharacterized protein (TIGR03437 family)
LKKLFSLFSLVAVLLTAGALDAQTISVAPTSLSFSTQAGGSAQSQSLALTATTATQFLATANVSTGSWLKIKQQGDASAGTQALIGTTPVTLIVTADPTGLPAGGPYTGTVTITPSGGSSSTLVNVTMTVSTIGATPSPLTFTYQVNGAIPNPATLTLTSATTTTYAATGNTTSGGSWLSVPANGTAPGTLAVGLNSAVVGPTMAPGTYNGSVTITPATGPATAVPVTLTVTAAPTVTVSASTINLNYQIGGATGASNAASQTLTLTNPGSQPLGFLIQSASPSILISPNQGTIPATGSTAVTVSYVTTSNLTPNTYSVPLTVFVPGAANASIAVTAKLLVSNSPLMNVPSDTLSFTYQIGSTVPAAKNVTVTSTAVAADAAAGQQMALFISKSDNSAWLSVPGSGTTGTASPIAVAVNPTGLAVGTYNATITILGAAAGNNPQTIPVTLTVTNDPLVVASFGGCSTANTGSNGCVLNFPYQIGQTNPTTQNIRVQSSTGAQASFTATAAMNPSAACGTSWLSSGVTAAVVGNDTNFPITVTPGAIVSGTTCTGTITIAGTNATTGAALPNSPVVVPVNLFVSSNAMLIASPVGISFNIAPNASSFQTLTVTSTSATNLDFTATIPPTATWLTVGPTTRNTAAGSNSVIVAASANGLAPGTYSTAITLTSTGALDSPITVPVTLTVTAATMTVTPASLTFNQTLGGAAPAAKTLSVATSSTDIAFNTTVSMDNGTAWLSATPTSATATSATPAAITVSVNGTNLAAGTYTGKVTITSTSPFTSGSPISIPVTFVVAPGTLSVTPAALTFNQVQGGQAPASQTIAVAGTPGALAYTVTTATNGNSGNWLSLDSTSGSTPGNVKVSVNSGSLAVGQYTGKVTITSTGATGSPIDIPVTLNVVTPQSVAVAPATLTFNYVLNSSTALQPQTVQLTTAAGVAFTTSVQSSATWLSATPASGSGPTTLTVTVNPAGLAAGNYTGTISVNSPSAATNPAATITVNLTVQAVPKPVPTAVQNAASAVIGAVSPGENIAIYGSGLGPATLVLGHITNGTYDTTVANTRVLFDGVPAPIIYAWANQTSVMVPYFVGRGPTTNMVIEYQGVQSASIALSVASSAPGIYSQNQSGSGPGAILNQDFSVNAAANPAAKNSVVAVYMTGEGTTSPASTDGAVAPINGTGLFKPLLGVTATVGGVPATVEYYGSAPGIVYGVMQVNVRIPATAPSGANVPIVITVGNTTTQTGSAAITLAVQ